MKTLDQAPFPDGAVKTRVQYLLGGFFFLIATAAALAVPVTFMVDMSGVAGFTDGDFVEVRGDFNGWNPGTLLVASANPYILTNTVEITDAAGTVELYKFTRNGIYELDGLG